MHLFVFVPSRFFFFSLSLSFSFLSVFFPFLVSLLFLPFLSFPFFPCLVWLLARVQRAAAWPAWSSKKGLTLELFLFLVACKSISYCAPRCYCSISFLFLSLFLLSFFLPFFRFRIVASFSFLSFPSLLTLARSFSPEILQYG